MSKAWPNFSMRLGAMALFGASVSLAGVAQLTQDETAKLNSALGGKTLVIKTYASGPVVKYFATDDKFIAIPSSSSSFAVFTPESTQQVGKVLEISGNAKSYVRLQGTHTLAPSSTASPMKIAVDITAVTDHSAFLASLPEALFFSSLQEAYEAIPPEKKSCLPREYSTAAKALVETPECSIHTDPVSLIQPPELIYQIAPVLPDGYREHAKKGPRKIVVSLVVAADGIPANLKIASSEDAALDTSALDAVRAYRFKPAMANDKAVPFSMNVVVSFEVFGR